MSHLFGMERPAKRLKVSRPDVHSPKETGSRMTEGLFTSEMDMQSSDDDNRLQASPTRTISISDLRRRNRPVRRQHVPYNDEGLLLRPRAPDATVTASVIAVQLNEGTATIPATEITAGTSDSIVSISGLGSVTVPALITVVSNSTSITSDISSTARPTDSTTTGSVDSSYSSTSLSTNSNTNSSTTQEVVATTYSNALPGTISTNSTTEPTVTVTATSTFEVSYVNGTLIPLIPPVTVTPATSISSTTLSTNTTSTSTSHQHTTESSRPLLSSTVSPTSSLTSPLASSTSSTSVEAGSSISTSYSGSIPVTSNTAGTAGTAVSSSASTSATSTPHSSGPGLTPTQQSVVGGVVGGVAGIAVVLLLLLFFLRWYRRRLKSRGQLPEQLRTQAIGAGHTRGFSTGTNAGSSYEMSQSKRSSNVPLAAALATSFKRWRPHSAGTFGTTGSQTTASGVDVAPAATPERGFQRIAGRKIAPVLGSGDDGYGGNFGAFEKETTTDYKAPERDLSRTSFYRDSQGFYGGTGAGSSTHRSSSAPGTPRGRVVPGHTRGPSQTRDFADTEQGLPPGSPLASSHARASYSPLKARSEVALGLGSASRPEGYAAMRPGPARTPTMTSSQNISQIRLSMPQGPQRRSQHSEDTESGHGVVGGLVLDPDAPPTPPLPQSGLERGRLAVPGGPPRSAATSRGSGSRFRENVD